MKNLIEFINESRQYAFTEEQRDALASLIGFLTGNIGDSDVIAEYEEFKESLTPKELEQFDNAYDYLDDTVTYKKVRISSFFQDIDKNLLKRFLEYAMDNELHTDYEYEIEEIYEICQ